MGLVRRLSPVDATIIVDGVRVPARSGESLAAALLSSGTWPPFYCGMGVCFTCCVTIDGTPGRRACIEPVRDGMTVQAGSWDGHLGDAG